MALNFHRIFDISVWSTWVLSAGLIFVLIGTDADSFQKQDQNSEIQNQQALVISQNEPDNSSKNEKKDRAAESKDPDTQSKESQAKKEQDFIPSIKIDAESAVAFPYDI